jgi:futalosine hydrolase
MIASAKFARLKQMKEQGRLLIVSATETEVDETRSWVTRHRLPVDFCITGPGIAATVWQLARSLREMDYNLVLNAGIAGTFNENIALTEVVHVIDDSFADLGAEDGESFLHISEMGFSLRAAAFNQYYFPVSLRQTPEPGLRKVKAITVNKVHGHEPSILKIRQRFNPDIETMEGAAVAYVCHEMNIPCLQIRSISNRVEKRDKSKWKIELAVASLNRELIKLLKEH